MSNLRAPFQEIAYSIVPFWYQMKRLSDYLLFHIFILHKLWKHQELSANDINYYFQYYDILQSTYKNNDKSFTHSYSKSVSDRPLNSSG